MKSYKIGKMPKSNFPKIVKKSFKNLVAGRGDWKTKVSKIAYYGAIQNFMFTSLQNALFGLLFGGEDEEDFIAKFFTFKTISVTSSLTPLIDENSCKTPSI